MFIQLHAFLSKYNFSVTKTFRKYFSFNSIYLMRCATRKNIKIRFLKHNSQHVAHELCTPLQAFLKRGGIQASLFLHPPNAVVQYPKLLPC